MKRKIKFLALFCMASICLFSSHAYGCPITVTSGSNPFCYTSTITLSVSGGAALESWKSSNPLVAIVNPGYTVGSGICTVSGVGGGTTTITYLINLVPQCTLVLTVDPAPTAGTISGTLVTWSGMTTTLTSSGTGGVWSSGNLAIANVGSATGVVTGHATGTVNITYTVNNTCGTNRDVVSVTVNPYPTMPAKTPVVWYTPPSCGAVAGINTAMILGYDQMYAFAYWDGVSTGAFEIQDYYPGNSSGVIPLLATLGTPIGTPDIIIGNTASGTESVHWLVAVAYPTTGGVEVDYYDFKDSAGAYYGITFNSTSTYSGIPKTVHIDGIAEAGNTGITGYPYCEYAVVTWDDLTTGGVYASYIDLQSPPGTLTPKFIDYGEAPDVAAIQRTASGLQSFALITYTSDPNDHLYYAEWNITGTGSVSSPITLDALTGGSAVYTPRIDAIDDYTINGLPSLTAVYKVVAQVDNSSTGYNEIRTYDNLLYAASTYWTSSNVISLPVSYATPPPYDHYAPSVSLGGPILGVGSPDAGQYMVPHFTHYGSWDILYMEPIDYATSNALASPGYDYWVSEYTPTSTGGGYANSVSSPCNGLGGCSLVAWAYPGSSTGCGTQTNIEYTITPYLYSFKHNNTNTTGSDAKTRWQVYPNPANEQLIIANAGAAGTSSAFTITDMLGRQELQGDVVNGSRKIDISRLGAGNYLIKIRSEDGSSDTQMFVKQ